MKNNFFKNLPIDINSEIFEEILRVPSFKIEKIISYGHKSDKDFWYDQEQNEWVMLLKGYAEIEFFGAEIVTLYEGDFIHIAKNQKHRVNATLENEKTIWLAIFYD